MTNKGKKTWTPEQIERLEVMARLRAAMLEKRAQRVRLVQKLHC